MYQNDISEKLRKITGREIPDRFGQPFIKIFEQAYSGSLDEILAAAYTCSLFLSCLMAKMPSEPLRTFTYYTKERCGRFSFNCNMYETLFAKTEDRDLNDIPLLNENKEERSYTLSKQEVFEAFDFYTNR